MFTINDVYQEASEMRKLGMRAPTKDQIDRNKDQVLEMLDEDVSISDIVDCINY